MNKVLTNPQKNNSDNEQSGDGQQGFGPEPLHQLRSSCALANGLEVLGDRWTMLIIRDLMFTNRNQFGQLLDSGEGISTNILSERLERLQNYQIIEKLPHPTHGRKSIYRLADKGLGLAPILIELTLWSYKSVAGSFIPEDIHYMLLNEREKIYQQINRREPLFIVS